MKATPLFLLRLLPLLFLLFLGLKLTGIITWSWWWVTVPLWGGLVLAFIFLLICLVYLIPASARKAMRKTKGEGF